jgi:lipoprotein-releasing system permease protein
MIRPLECFIGLRYLSSGRGRGLVSFMSLASFLGIGLGVGALIVILSAMNGLESESRSRLLSLSDHITVETPPGADIVSLQQAAVAVDGVRSVSPYVRLEAMLSAGTNLEPVQIRGVLPAAEPSDSDIASVVGPEALRSLDEGASQLLIGGQLGFNLGVVPGDRVTVWRAELDGNRPRPSRAGFTVAGFFEAGVEQHDTALALTHLADASRLLGLGGEPEGLAIRLVDPMDVTAVQRDLTEALGPGLHWSNWADENRSLFQAMAIEKTMITIVLMFIAGIAAFNIVASLMMLVNEKEKDIAILRTMGLEPQKLTRVFLFQGALVGIGGALAGAFAGLALALNLETVLPWLEQTLGFQILPGDVYYVSNVPSEIRLGDVLLIPAVAILISLLATIYPSRRAARIEPADVLRYE